MSKQPKRFAHIEIVPAADARNVKPSARRHFLRLVASNGLTLAHSETYASLTNARRAVDGWLRAFDEVAFSPEAPVVEVSE